ncbi:ATP-binding protein [Knoellia remsis]|uniref:ATP-binding protein n=1 Tax=Knoellia remsis TaxID=407159 RepID=UPI0011B1F647|nr:AAA family ATPase [Knoellia remsis]
MSNEPVIAALRASLAADPGNHDVRVHVASLLSADGRTDEALAEASAVLAGRPDHLGALTVAESAARRLGDIDRADAYARLLAALGGSPSSASPSQGGDPATGAGAPGRADGIREADGIRGADGIQGNEPTVSDGEPEGSDSSTDPVEIAYAGTMPDSPEDLFAEWSESEAAREPEVGTLGRPGVTLADVGGLADVKKRLNQSFLMQMRNPELRATFGKSLRGGLVLWGPPGCGKTFIARAVAGELGASFYEVGLADVLDMYIGSSERNLRSIFDAARRNRPCVLFFDELDALGQKRAQLRGAGAMRGVVNQMLAELDGASTDNEGLFVLAATNHPWDVDSALLRPGRFDRTVLVLPPDREAREAIFSLHLRSRPMDRVDVGQLAKATDGYSGADIALVCEQATESAMEESMAAGQVRPITAQHLRDAVASVRPSIGEWMETAKNYALYSNSSGEYDELTAYLKRRRR